MATSRQLFAFEKRMLRYGMPACRGTKQGVQQV